jgi:hypothetical protein
MRFVIVAACAAVCLAGCSNRPKTAPVSGKMAHKGKPMTAGSVYLHPAAGNTWAGEPPSSVLQLDGSFEMRTFPHGLGVPPGPWKVTLSPALAGRVGKPELGDPARTPWTLDVPDEGVSDKVFEVK